MHYATTITASPPTQAVQSKVDLRKDKGLVLKVMKHTWI